MTCVRLCRCQCASWPCGRHLFPYGAIVHHSLHFALNGGTFHCVNEPYCFIEAPRLLRGFFSRSSPRFAGLRGPLLPRFFCTPTVGHFATAVIPHTNSRARYYCTGTNTVYHCKSLQCSGNQRIAQCSLKDRSRLCARCRVKPCECSGAGNDKINNRRS